MVFSRGGFNDSGAAGKGEHGAPLNPSPQSILSIYFFQAAAEQNGWCFMVNVVR